MIICYLADVNSAHTRKWCNYFTSSGHDVHVISFWPGANEQATVHVFSGQVSPHGSSLSKLRYLVQGPELRRILKSINPDIIHAHYASSYGAACALAGIDRYFLSVWGSDVYDFPRSSPVHRALIKKSLSSASRLLSTSNAMAVEASRYTDGEFAVTPFGVDLDVFSSKHRSRSLDDHRFVVGTVKTLAPKYGISDIIRACGEVCAKRPDIPLELRLSGSGPQEIELKELARTLGLAERTTWPGFISQEEAAREWANMDLAVIPSVLDSESFGVAAVEAQACETPVIITDVPGLMESTLPGVSSVVVRRHAHTEIAEAIIALYDDPARRAAMGSAGLDYVGEHYEYHACFRRVEDLYRHFLDEG